MDEDERGGDGVSKDNITSFAGARMALQRRSYAWQKDYLQSLIAALQKLPREARLNVNRGRLWPRRLAGDHGA
jgi:hypothetical protein